MAGRPRTVDVTNLVVAYPANNCCRCFLCGRTFSGFQSSIKRHYQLVHPEIVLPRQPDSGIPAEVMDPQHVPDRTVRDPPAENGEHLIRSPGKSDLSLDAAMIMSCAMETGGVAEGQSSSQKPKEPDVVDIVELSDDELIDADEMRFSQALNQTSPVTSGTLSMRSTPSAQTTGSSQAIGASTYGSVDDAYFLQYLGSKLAHYSTRTKHMVQLQILRILYEADMGCFEEGETRK
ncbi:uncharacterized protein DMAD_09165 [Drosophila madeirensis]|uniref:C2H2-type domain-containing protein n=1 Tax=Drosophila madeirensis TaxID=30013 RepID=A0AAU9F571_DROMD